jgi:NADH:ubiquinone oxidoreductase subunit B-like Fe-S oxidoreductase
MVIIISSLMMSSVSLCCCTIDHLEFFVLVYDCESICTFGYGVSSGTSAISVP